jgi:hypothetical protein
MLADWNEYVSDYDADSEIVDPCQAFLALPTAEQFEAITDDEADSPADALEAVQILARGLVGQVWLQSPVLYLLANGRTEIVQIPRIYLAA